MNTKLELGDVQGNIAWGYRHTHFKQLFGTIRGDAGSWKDFLLDVANQVTRSGHVRDAAKATLNVGISYAGLAQLVPNWGPKLTKCFPAFAAGMGMRAIEFGDPKDLDYGQWDRRHVWLSIHATDTQILKERITTLVALAGKRSLVLDDSSEPGAVIERNGGRLEHFGFRDGISNPVFAGADTNKRLAGNGKRDPKTNQWVPIATGEFLLGYENEQGRDLLDGLPEDLQRLLRNGTFAVLRILEQDVAGFRTYVASKERALGCPHLDEKMMGRTRDGRALAAPGNGNDFDYHDDPDGTKCPLGAHVRRANPRASGEHRLLRRSIPYGEYVERGEHAMGKRGIYFMAFNASIENQFEFLQRYYMNGQAGGHGDFSEQSQAAGQRSFGKLSDAKDPVGACDEGMRRMAIEGDTAANRDPILLLDVPAFVTCRGGQYYFVPGIGGLRELGRRTGAEWVQVASAEAVGEGARP